MIPGVIVSRRARTGEREIVETQATQVLFDLPGAGALSGKRPFGARLERIRKTIPGDVPALGVGLTVQAIDDLRFNRRAQQCPVYRFDQVTAPKASPHDGAGFSGRLPLHCLLPYSAPSTMTGRRRHSWSIS